MTIFCLGASFSVNLPSCPSCRLALVSEDLATGTMAEVERAMEHK